MTKTTALSIIAVFWLLSILCGGVAGFFLYPHVYPCNSNVVDVKVEVTDSFAPNKDTVAKVWNPAPVKTETRKFRPAPGGPGRKEVNGVIPGFTGGPDMAPGISGRTNQYNYGPGDIGQDNIGSAPGGPGRDGSYYCLDTNIYKNDTISVDNFRATSTAYVTNNELIKLQIEWLNLKPELWKIKRETVTVEKKKSIVKIYTGLYGGLSIQNKTVASYHGGVGLDAIISDRHMIGLQGGLNSALQMEFGVRFGEKIRLKK